jgi:hypothetical protein
LLQALCKRRKPCLSFWIVRGEVHKHADAPHSLNLLCARRDLPRSRSAGKRDYEFPPPNVDCHATLPLGGRVHAIMGHDIML